MEQDRIGRGARFGGRGGELQRWRMGLNEACEVSIIIT